MIIIKRVAARSVVLGEAVDQGEMQMPVVVPGAAGRQQKLVVSQQSR